MLCSQGACSIFFGLTDCLTGSANKWGWFYYFHFFLPGRTSGSYRIGFGGPSILEARVVILPHANYQPYFLLWPVAWHTSLPWHRGSEPSFHQLPVASNDKQPCLFTVPCLKKKAHGRFPKDMKFQFFPVLLITAFHLDRYLYKYLNLITVINI